MSNNIENFTGEQLNLIIDSSTGGTGAGIFVVDNNLLCLVTNLENV